MKNKNRVYIVLVILLISIIAGMSYALWQITRTQTDKNIVTTGCFEVTTDLGTEDEQSPISIENAYPILDSEGLSETPFTFTITNTCDVYATYQINLETLSATTLNKDYVKVSLNNVGPGILSSFDSVEPTITGATTSNKLLTGGLKAGQSLTFNLRLWMDQDTPMSEGQNKAYQGKISIVASPGIYTPPVNPCTFDGELVQGAEYTDGTYTYRYKQESDGSSWTSITEDGWGVKLSDTSASGEINTPICTSINGKPIVSMSSMYYNARDLTSIDVSSFDTSSVVRMDSMFFNTGYNSSSFEIVGLNTFDISNVTNMSSMFYSAGRNATTWNIGDLSNWDTSNVTNMSSMFSSAGYNATTFNLGDLSNWDTSNVTNMSRMFNSAGRIASTWNIGDLSNWVTSNVTTMSGMFNEAGYNATTWNIGDLSGWDTSNVTTMLFMFDSAADSAATFNIGNLSTWDTSKVTDMSYMFGTAGYNATTWNIGDLSGWDTSNVTNMSYMFNATGYNATTWNIGDLSLWNTSKVTTMSNMFKKAGKNATTWNSIGTLKVYAANIYMMFYDCKNAKATLNIYSNPASGNSGYNNAFYNAATVAGSGITVNYSSTTTNINAIIATKSSNSNVVKGVKLD